MLRFLLDEHLSPEIAEHFHRRRPEIPVCSMQTFSDGALLGADDRRILMAAQEGGWTLVTRDRRTIWPLLQALADEGVPHAGVVFLSRRGFAAHDIGRLVSALAALWDARSDLDWADRSIFL